VHPVRFPVGLPRPGYGCQARFPRPFGKPRSAVLTVFPLPETFSVAAHRLDGSDRTPITLLLDLDEKSFLVRLTTAPEGPVWLLSTSDARVLGWMFTELGERSCCASTGAPNRCPRIVLGNTRWILDEAESELFCEDDHSRRLRYGLDAN
jgi:hypothetical protein